MFKDEYKAVCNGGARESKPAEEKSSGLFCFGDGSGNVHFLRKLRGIYPGISDQRRESCFPDKVFQGFCFASALSLVVMAGAELFTGNNFRDGGSCNPENRYLGRHSEIVGDLLDRKPGWLCDLCSGISSDGH